MVHNKESFCYKEIGIDPDVRGYQILVRAAVVPERTAGGIIRTNTYIDDQKRRQNIGLVLKIGPSAFTTTARGISYEDRRCAVGQWIHYSSLEREPLYVGTHYCYYINDERVIAILSEEDVTAILQTGK